MPAPPLLRLHGYPVSNYFNIARAALLEKGLAHEIVGCRASQHEAFLERSPMGKIPMLETSAGWLAETVAILEYLDDAFPAFRLRPDDIFERARARQIVNIAQVYVEVPVRNLFPGVFGAGTNSAAGETRTRVMLDRSIGALRRLLHPSPYVFGDRPGAADLFLFYNLDIADRVTRFVYDRSIRDEIGLGGWDAAMRARPSTRAVLADFDPAFAAYLLDHGAAYRETVAPKVPYHA